MKHCPCEGCKNSIGGVDCRLNVENECKAAGGYEAWEPMPHSPTETQPVRAIPQVVGNRSRLACLSCGDLQAVPTGFREVMPMTFYHFCADRHIKGILRNGLTEVGKPARPPRPHSARVHKGI